MKLHPTCFALPSVLILFGGLTPPASVAQIIPDASLPVNSSVASNGNRFILEGGTQAAGNLFHSFQEFSLPTGTEAFFNNALDVHNIFTRVTGGNISNIDGFIRANGTANLFLLNPNGIVFGPNARLDIGGSFLGSTADSVLFQDGSVFSAIEPNASPLLTLSVPIGLQVGSNPGSIAVRGPGHQIFFQPPINFVTVNRPVGLQVPTGQMLALVGGDILLDGGNITARDGRIETWSVRHTEVSLDTASGLQLSHLGAEGTDWGTVTLERSASMDASGTQGGAIEIRGRSLRLEDGSYIFSYTWGTGTGAGISVQTSESVELLGVSAQGQFVFPGIQNLALGGSDSQSGNITVTTGRLEIANGATISEIPLGAGSSSGDIIIQASDVILQGHIPFPPFFGSGMTNIILNPSGDGGNIIIDADRVKLLNGGLLSTEIFFGSGTGGDILIRAAQSVEVRGMRADAGTSLLASSVYVDGAGQGGNIAIETGNLVVAQGGQITTAVAGAGQAGNIEIRAANVFVSDPVLAGTTETISGITAKVREGAIGDGGRIEIEANRLRVFNGGQITSANEGEGQAGNITLQVQALEVQGSGALVALERPSLQPRPENGRFTPSAISASSANRGTAGSIDIIADTVSVADTAGILVSNTGGGDAGNLNATARNISLDGGGNLQAQVTGGTQGNINLNLDEGIFLRRGSSIAANATGTSIGGNISIDTNTLVALENSDISANAEQSFGGRVNITAQGLFGTQFRDALTPESDITATSALGTGFSGVVQLKTPDVDTTVGLVNFSQETVDPAEQVVSGCQWTGESEFIATGRGGVPASPNRPVWNHRTWSDVRDLSAFRGERVEGRWVPVEKPERLQEATGWVVNEDGTVMLVAATDSAQTGNFLAAPCNPLSHNR